MSRELRRPAYYADHLSESRDFPDVSSAHRKMGSFCPHLDLASSKLQATDTQMPTRRGGGAGARVLSSKCLYPSDAPPAPAPAPGGCSRLRRALPLSLGDQLSSPSSRKTGLPGRGKALRVFLVLSHPNIDTREISCPPWARLSLLADHQPWPPRGEVPKRNWGP